MRPLILLLALALWSQLAAAGDHGKYEDALAKAKEAALIQSGVKLRVDTATAQLEAYATWRAETLGIDKPVAAMLYCTKIYRDRAVTLKIDINKHIRIELDRAALVIDF